MWSEGFNIPKFGYCFHQMRLDKISDPCRWFLTKLSLQLYFQNTVFEELFIFERDLLERMVNIDICAPPVVARAYPTIPIVFSNHCEFGIKRYPNPRISRQLERGSVVKTREDVSKIYVTNVCTYVLTTGFNFLVNMVYWTSFASWIIESTSCCVFLPLATSCWNSSSIVYSPRKKALTRCSWMGKRAFTDFSPVQSSRCVLRSTKIYTS